MNEAQQAEARRLRRLLQQMYKIAEHASLTGALAGGAEEIVQRYNLVLTRLAQLGIETGGLFPPLPPDVSLDRVGVASRLLYGYLEDDADEGEGHFGPRVVINNGPGMPDLDHLKDIGRIVRENIAESFRTRPFEGGPFGPPPEEAPTQPRQ